MNQICRGCPGSLMGDCAACSVTLDDDRREAGEDGDDDYCYGEEIGPTLNKEAKDEAR